jgi:hypothetical protein
MASKYLLHIMAVPFSNICPQTDRPDEFFGGLSSMQA